MTFDRQPVAFVLAAALCAGPASAQDHTPHRAVRAVRTVTPPQIDGRLTEESWRDAEPITDFTQQDPDEGQPATERTEIRVLYDDTAIYVGALMFDGEPTLISRRLSARDTEADADRLTVYLDPMHDHLTGVMFRVSAAGVQHDWNVFNDTWTDQAWDAVWISAVTVDDHGWSAELRIPLSQLRFPSSVTHIWGFNVERYVRRKNEYAWLELVPKSQSGLASRMAHLIGLDGLRPRRHIEVLPYVATRTEFIQPSHAGNPFNDGSRSFGSVGMDMKWGLTSNLTLDATFNPDFGQVEVDPAVVNLTAFETFFPEKRPFFLEGAQIFGNFGLGGANGNWGFNSSDPMIFYSRRVGRAPQLPASGEFTDLPSATTILGAAKLSGKTASGWSIGLLDAVTQREEARVHSAAFGGRVPTEPLTNYVVARVKRDGQRVGGGLIATAVHRQLDAPELDGALPSQAYVAGVDGYYFFDRRLEWVIGGKLAASRIGGSPAAIARAQLAAQRYFQRPDVPHVRFDPLRTSLSGLNGRIHLNRNSGLWQVNAALWGVSPGFESNDVGFMESGDRAGAHGVFVWRKVTPDRFSRHRLAWVAKFWTWNFNRDVQADGVIGLASVVFLNYWSVAANIGIFRETQDDQLTRGGPSAINPASRSWNVNMRSDSRKWLSFEAVGAYSDGAAGWRSNTGLTLNIKPSPKWTLSTGPDVQASRTTAQYIRAVGDATATDTLGARYVFGAIDQRQLTLTTRVSVILSPRHSLQIFAQPLLAAGDYSEFKELAFPRTYTFRRFGGSDSLQLYDPSARMYTIDPDAAGSAPAFDFADPDFNFKSLRVNAIFRWEFNPGSALYLVWTRQQQDFTHPGDFALRRDAVALLSAPGDDVFLVKLAYWLGR